MRFRFEFLAVAALTLLGGCAGQTFAPEEAPEFLVIKERTPLYRYGPQQSGAPEEQLRRDERLRMLRHELGFSLVQISDGQTGYVANEDLAPAPPRPQPPPSISEERETFTPLPEAVEAPLPGPDLEAPPADAPAN